jgi:dihydroorotate dehydrogenase electron transfer subunit
MMRRAAELALGAGAGCEVSLENRMACGYGVCLGCAVPRREAGYALVCREGPVFDAQALRWEGLP